MNPVTASMAEIIRVGGWSLRGLGYAFGVAERGVRHLAWAEAVHGGFVRTIRAADARIAASAARPAARPARDGGGWHVAASGKHLLELGPPVLDLLTAEARDHGAGRVTVSGALGVGLLASLCDLGARRGLACIAAYRAVGEDDLPDGVAPAGWLAGWPSPDGPAFVGGAPDALVSMLTRIAPDLPAPPVTATDEPLISLVAVPAPGPDALRTAGDGLVPMDYGPRLAAAYRSGITMHNDDLQHLYALERRTWAPTSERSRAQAGYGKY